MEPKSLGVGYSRGMGFLYRDFTVFRALDLQIVTEGCRNRETITLDTAPGHAAIPATITTWDASVVCRWWGNMHVYLTIFYTYIYIYVVIYVAVFQGIAI